MSKTSRITIDNARIGSILKKRTKTKEPKMTDFDYYQSEYQDDYEPEPIYENYAEHEHDIYKAQ